MDKRILFHFPWISWVMIILVLSFIPGHRLPDIHWKLISPDTLAHVGMYFVLSVLLIIGLTSKKLNLLTRRLYIITLLAGIVLGISVELVQGFFIYRRYFDLKDIIANSFGTVFGLVAVAWIGRKLV